MKKQKFFISIILIISISVGSLSMGRVFAASSLPSDFEVSDGILIRYKGLGGDVVIPGDIGITEIGQGAFELSKITSVVIPEGVTKTDYFSFASCNLLTSIVFPNSLVTIGDASFYGCNKLTTVKIPEGVQVIEETAFADCSNLTAIEIPKSVVTVGTEIFVNTKIPEPVFIKNNSVLCYVPQWYSSYIVPNTVTEIAGGAFYKCTSLKSVDLPDGVIAIGDTAFFQCTDLNSINIPDSVVSIGYSAFYGCSNLSSLLIPKGVSLIGFSAFQGTKIPSPIYLANNSILCYVPASVNSFDIPSTVRIIVGGAFGGCTNLKSIVIPDTVSTIDTRTFTNCSALESVTLPQKITSIVDYMFMNCTSLKSIALPNSIVSIGSCAFMGCSSLNSIVLPQGVTSINDDAFWDCKALKTITLPASVTTIGNNAFLGAGLHSIYILSSTISFGGVVFYENDDLTIYGLPGSTAEKYAKQSKIPFSYIFFATPNASKVTVNGKTVPFDAYTISGYNFFKLRDLAQALNGSAKQYEVSFNSESNAISITSGKPYTAVGGELTTSGNNETVIASFTTSKVFLDGNGIELNAYTINGYNYFKLRDIGAILNFSVTWNGSTNTIEIDTEKPYNQNT